MADLLERAARPRWLTRVVERTSTRGSGTSLYVRVVAINAAIVAVATVLLAVTPVTVGYPIALEEAIVLLAGVVLVALANALLLRISFGPLAQVVRRMETVDLLRPQERLPVDGGPEVRAVVTGLNEMLDRLESERRESSRRTLAALEGERRRISRELHDEIGQRLTGTLLQLGNLTSDAPPSLRARVEVIQDDLRSTLDQIGVLSWQLRPGILDDLGLGRALEALVESFDEQTPGIRIEHSLPASLPSLTPEEELAIYRIVQEALTNAVRHAGAERIDVTVAADAWRLSVTVSDDGIGSALERDDGGGTRGMRERALAVDGRLTIEAGPNTGFRVSLALPRPHHR
jgi:two-component system sensor histidine kinase UhpB